MREYFFQTVKLLISERKIGETITRSELIWQGVNYYKAGDKNNINSTIRSCVDLILRYFKQHNVIKVCGRGEYKIIKFPDSKVVHWNDTLIKRRNR